MKVICIEDKFKWQFDGRSYEPKDPKFGEICFVTNQMNYKGLLLYRLEGYNEWYNSKKFIPVSDVDETELVNQIQQTHK